MFVYIIVAKIELFESGAYLHSKLTKEQLYNICACTSFKCINHLNIVIHQTMFLMLSTSKIINNQMLTTILFIPALLFNYQALSSDLGIKKYPCLEEIGFV